MTQHKAHVAPHIMLWMSQGHLFLIVLGKYILFWYKYDITFIVFIHVQRMDVDFQKGSCTFHDLSFCKPITEANRKRLNKSISGHVKHQV